MNQNPEQQARDRIDQQLIAYRWTIQSKTSIDLHEANGVAVHEHLIGVADYVICINTKPVGSIEPKLAREGVYLAIHDEQQQVYGESKCKSLKSDLRSFVNEEQDKQ